MKKSRFVKIGIAVLLICVFGLFAIGSGESSAPSDQGNANAEQAAVDNTKLGDYNIEIKSCRLAKDYEGKDVVIVKYGFTNNAENAAVFYIAFNDAAYQSGIGLNEAYMLANSANYDAENQTKEIKTGASLDVEVAYQLNDRTTDVEIEVKETFSFSDAVIKKTFSIAN